MPLTQLFGRIFYPLGVIIVTIIGFSVGFERRKGGQGVPIAIGLSVSFIYLTLLKTLEPLGYSGQLYPIFAAALPHLVFAGAAVYLIRSYRSW
jgi:lipopolysaccharide export system permease protein